MNKICLCSLWVGALLFPPSSHSQNFTYTKVAIVSAAFSGGNLTIRKDEGGNYTSPQWQAVNTVQSPVAYVSGNKPTVAASFTIDCARVPDSVLIRGMGSDSINFLSTKVVVASSANTVHNILYPATSGSKAFASGVVRFFKPFSINWEISFDKGVTWKLIGTTENTLYVTKSAPMTESGDFKWWRTVFDLSCRNAAGEAADAAIISSIWADFKDQVLLNWNGDSLSYYKDWWSPNTTLAALLQYRDAECYSFAKIFIAAIKIQGIVTTGNYINVEAKWTYYCGGNATNQMLVKNWQFNTPSGSCPDFPYVNSFNTLHSGNVYQFIQEDVSEAYGTPGQCNENPPAYFNNHQIVKINGRYYDPSYGNDFAKIEDWMNGSLAGWGITMGGSPSKVYFTGNLNKTTVFETIETY
jgi:hypothetical protein